MMQTCMPALTSSVVRTLTRVAFAVPLLMVHPAAAQWVSTHEQFYLEARHNWQFRDRYMAADRLFNAFDFGHAILYETLWTKPNAPVSSLEEKQYDFLTKKVLIQPPRVPLEEGAIEIGYVQLAPEAKLMFEWAHVLHRQIYDVLADERLSDARKDSEVARLVAYYKTRPEAAFSSQPKSMALMQEQPYSLAFRQRYPKFNGLIWAYHWLQVGLYEPLLTGQSSDERQSLVRATVARFWQMLKDPPRTMPHQMPMTAAVSPRFTERYPEAAIIFDNLHSMHDVISDILANPSVPRNRKRAEILLAARRFRDDTSFIMTRDMWRNMARHMGIENMGGPAVGFLPELPAPSVTYGAVMTHDERTGEMTGFKYGSAVAGAAGAHAGHAVGDTAAGNTADTAAAGHDMTSMAGGNTSMTDTYMRMLADPVIRQRIRSDSALLRSMREAIARMPVEHRAHLDSLLAEPSAVSGAASRPAAARPTPTRKQPPRRPATTKPAPKTPDPHEGHKMPPPPTKTP